MTVSWDHGHGPHRRLRDRLLRLLCSAAVVVFACWGLLRAVDLQVAQAGGLSERSGVYLLPASGISSPSHVRTLRSESARWPTAAAMRWQPPQGFLRAAFCIHRHESVDWYRAYVDWRGYPSRYSGGLQFTLSTWQRAGGTGDPHEWRPREQVYRAYVIWRRNGGSWVEWGARWKCGLA